MPVKPKGWRRVKKEVASFEGESLGSPRTGGTGHSIGNKPEQKLRAGKLYLSTVRCFMNNFLDLG